MIKELVLIFILYMIFLASCSLSTKKIEEQIKINDSLLLELEAQLPSRSKNLLQFENVSEVVNDKHSTTWVKIENDSPSIWLHFNLYEPDTLQIEFTPECWASFPIITSHDKILVYWDNNIDTKYAFNIIKAMDKIDDSYIGKPFIIFSLTNDSTLSTRYVYPQIIEELNKSEKDRILFPKEFIATYTYLK